MMKSLAFPAAAILALIADPALADAIAVTVKQDAVVVGTASSADGNLNINSQSFGTFNLNTLSINDASFLAPPGILDTNALDVQQVAQGAAHIFEIDVSATGLTNLSGLQSLLSEFSVTGLTPGWTVQEFTSINGVPLSNTPVFGGNSASADVIASALLTNPYTAGVEYLIHTTPGVGEFNGGIDINAAVPGPVAGAGLPGIAAAGCMLLVLGRRRRIMGGG